MLPHYKTVNGSEGNSHSLGQEILCLRNLKAHHCIHHLCLKVLTKAKELYKFHKTSDQPFILDLNNSPPLTVPIVVFLHTKHLHE